MCGIAGHMAREGAGDAARVEAMGAAQAHRGPDGHRSYARDGVALRHERLAIVDLDTGQQPLFDDRERALIVNGEIYDDPEIRARMPDHPFRTGSDCEPLLALYEARGLAFLDDVRGMYGLALHDPEAGRLVVARDPFGIKQVYWAETEAGFFFASEAQALVEAGVVPRVLNTASAHQLVQLQFTTGRETVFAGVFRVLPGECLVVEAGRIVERRRLPALPRPHTRAIGAGAALRELDATLTDAVTVHQRADVPFGLFLSSGVDSTALLAVMARLSDAPVRTYTAAFPRTKVHDERLSAARMARASGAEHTEITIGPDAFFARLPEICAALDDPVADYSIVPYYLLSERAARDVKVVLCGIGGDELLAGYSRYRRQRRPWWLGGRKRRSKGPASGLDLFRTDASDWRVGIADAEAGALEAGYEPLQAAQVVDFVDWLPHNALVELDRCLMRWGLEGRTPLLDRRMADFALPLPDRLKLRNFQGKYLLRRWLAASDAATEPFARKRGFTVPVGEWIAGAADRLAPLVAADPGVAELCRPEVVTHVFRSEKGSRLLAWRLTFYALWHRRHMRGLAPEGDTFACLEAR